MLERFSTSLEHDLLEQFDRYITAHQFANRSEAIRDLIRQALVREAWNAGGQVVGVITLVYDHHEGQLTARLTDIEHQYHHQIVSTTHLHLNHDECMEVIIARGKATAIREMADKLTGLRGVKSGSLTAGAAEQDAPMNDVAPPPTEARHHSPPQPAQGSGEQKGKDQHRHSTRDNQGIHATQRRGKVLTSDEDTQVNGRKHHAHVSESEGQHQGRHGGQPGARAGHEPNHQGE